ncbi:hypothetical protein GQX73_g4370 [Xylaria multiplex]|uniref:Glucose-methanol-choline oxidoreductase N-terminal domain-containing protein n=1 Tax=Xylaria multiplex TaxID=323545 RepID=A0A7C8IPV5_9PEZI|nr:hypothetical protein GQX73_g4370 [Xylaria multiplex]
MFGSKLFILAVLSAVTVSGVAIERKQSCAKTCGTVCYAQADLDEAVSQGYGYYEDNETVGSNDYPHQYNNYEGFDFPDAGPWYEFPILSSGNAYTGGSPGADRVVFNADGKFQDAITHTGASGNNFVGCTMRSPIFPAGMLLATLNVGVACDETFDYIIAGAGTCGLVLANRLSADPEIRVAVIEPGEDVRTNPNVTDPALFTIAYGTSIDWQYSTTPQPAAGNRIIPWHAGKAIGGTSTINDACMRVTGMTYVRGDKAQFDAFEALGNEGWNWESLYPYLKMIEKFTVPSGAQAAAGATYDPDVHGETGHVHTGFPFSLVNGSFHELAAGTWAALGYALNEDVNAGSVRGFSTTPQTLDRDRNIRSDAARSYYYDIEDRPNLTLIKGTVRRITWADSSVASQIVAAGGVEYVTPDGELVNITAAKEVILSAGALRSPLILESSGVGNPSYLKSLGIEAKIDLPGVGEYLQEQPNTVLAYSDRLNLSGSAPYATFSTAQDMFGSELSDIETSTLAQIPDWAKKVAASNGAVKAANVEKLFRIQHDLIFRQNVTIGETLTAISGGYFLSAMWLLLPFSWGSVHLTSIEAINAPAIDPKYFLIDFDLDVQINLGRLAQKFWHTKPVSDFVGGSVLPEDGVLPLNASDKQWASYIGDSCEISFTAQALTCSLLWDEKANARILVVMPNHHPIGTASMMSRELGGVVDPKLRVYGTKNVRVVDGSILPLQLSGHLTATLYAVAERAAEFIIEAV